MTPIRFSDLRQLREDIFGSPLQHYVAILLSDLPVEYSAGAEERILQIGADTEAALIYCNYRERTPDGRLVDAPTAPYQFGSVSDSFNFGPVVFANVAALLAAIDSLLERLGNDPLPLDGGWYALRLRLSVDNSFVRIPEYLYTIDKSDFRKSGQKQFDYLAPSAERMQIDHEATLRQHLESIGGRLMDKPEKVNVSEGDFPVEASVIIPVRNRRATVGDAVKSALSQTASFEFNVIVVDNASTDGTSEVLAAIGDPRLHVITLTGAENHGIGGCWNVAIDSEHCGRFAVQLDSDDLYADEHTLEKIVAKFHDDQCGMVIGSYRTTDFDLNPIPPGVIDHREWSDRNGRNNALRVNGFGAPRAFYVPIARACRFPDVSYGEDYAMCLRVSREYYVGRIYEPIYLCRRWEGNSDADLSPEVAVAHQTYKDFVRTTELLARIKLNNVQFPEIFSKYDPDEDFGWLGDTFYDDDDDDDDDDDSDFDDDFGPDDDDNDSNDRPF